MSFHRNASEMLLGALFGRAVEVADPMRSLAAYLSEKPTSGRVIVIGVGKALARMTEAPSDNNAYAFFGVLGDQVVPGPMLMNVNDFRAILILNGPG